MKYFKSKINTDIVRIDNTGWLWMYNRKINTWIRYFFLEHPESFLEGRYNTTVEITEAEAFIEIL